MKTFDRILILSLVVGVWALVLKPTPINAHGGVSTQWWDSVFVPYMNGVEAKLDKVIEDVEELDSKIRSHKIRDH